MRRSLRRRGSELKVGVFLLYARSMTLATETYMDFVDFLYPLVHA